MTAQSLEAVAAITSVLAVRLVQLKTIARTQPTTKVEHVIPTIWLRMLRALRKSRIVTVRDFYRQLAGLGGFLLRKGVGEPGWIAIWRGTDKLLLALRGYHASAAETCSWSSSQSHPDRFPGRPGSWGRTILP